MSAFEARPVTVHHSLDGEIAIGVTRPDGVLVQPVELDGATLYVDLDDLRAPPFVLVDDASLALWWLSFVLGEDVADAVREVGDQSNPDPDVRPTAEPGPLSGAVVRLGVGLWLYRWWPSSDREGVSRLTHAGEQWLKTELGVLAWYAEDALGGTSIAEVLLSDTVGYVVDTAARSAEASQPLAAVRAVIESVPLDDVTYRRLSRLEDALLGSSEAAALLEAELQMLERSRAMLGGGRNDTSRIAGGYGDVPSHPRQEIASGSSTVAWGRTRPRMLGSREENMHWRILTKGGIEPRIAIRVDVGDNWDGEVFYAAVYSQGSPFPEAVLV